MYDSGPGLREYLGALRRYWWLALLTFILVLAAAIGSLYVIDPVYRAEAEVLIRTQDSRQLFPRTSGTSEDALMRSQGAELAYVRSDGFQQLAVEAAGDEAEVEVRGGGDAIGVDSGVLIFAAEAGDPEAAQAAAQTWAETYVATRQEEDVRATTALRDLLIGNRERLQARLQEILQPVTALDEVVAAETDPEEQLLLVNQQLAIQRTLAPALDPVETELREVNTQIARLDVDLRVMGNPDSLAYVSNAAELPEERANGSLTQNTLVGIVAGLVLALGAVAAARALRRR